MTKKDKELLLKDLCARLPYGVKVQPCGSAFPHKFIGYDKGLARIDTDQRYELDDIKPYLRPMSSMTEEEDNEWQLYKSRIAESCDELLEKRIAKLHDWFCKKHLDFRGLIPLDLALPAPEDMYNI